jgi:hypothetical protein
MKLFVTIMVTGLFTFQLAAQTGDQKSKTNQTAKHLYLDVHHVGPGKVTAKDVAGAHQKDLAAQKKYGVNFIKYWLDEANGNIYCLAEASDSQSVWKTHKEAHGLVPDQVHLVTEGEEAAIKGKKDLYLDLHVLGAGNVNAKAVAGAHQKDLAVQNKHGVNFINYWVDEKNGTVVCLAQAPNADSVINTHKEAHGLIPVKVERVKQGQ